jgi:hypothetical protein
VLSVGVRFAPIVVIWRASRIARKRTLPLASEMAHTGGFRRSGSGRSRLSTLKIKHRIGQLSHQILWLAILAKAARQEIDAQL